MNFQIQSMDRIQRIASICRGMKLNPRMEGAFTLPLLQGASIQKSGFNPMSGGEGEPVAMTEDPVPSSSCMHSVHMFSVIGQNPE